MTNGHHTIPDTTTTVKQNTVWIAVARMWKFTLNVELYDNVSYNRQSHTMALSLMWNMKCSLKAACRSGSDTRTAAQSLSANVDLNVLLMTLCITFQ